MNLNSLNSIVDNIKNIDKKLESIDYIPVFEYCVKKHNETIKILKEVYDFVEKNIEIFENPKGGWNSLRNMEYHKDYQIGNSNIYNCVLRDIHGEGINKSYRTYWVDDGIIFHYNPTIKKVCYLTDLCEPHKHGYEPNIKMWNSSRDKQKMFMGIGYGIDGWSQYNGMEVDWEANMWTIDTIPYKNLITEIGIGTYRDHIEDDFKHAERIVERLYYTLSKINESVIQRQKNIDEIFDKSTIGKTTKYTIEITRIDD